MTAQRFVHPLQQWVDENGAPANGYRLYFYQTQTDTPLAVYSDASLTTPITQPVVADSTGVFEVIFMQSAVYKVILNDDSATSANGRLGVEIYSQDPYDARQPTIPTPTSAVITFDIVIRYGQDGGDPIATGTADGFRTKITGTVQGWTIVNDQSGSVTWDVRRKAYDASSAPAGANSIVASAPPTTSAVRANTNTTLTGWTTAFTTGDEWAFVLTAVDGVVTRSTLSLHCSRTITLS